MRVSVLAVIAIAGALCGLPARGQVQELFSQYVQVYRPVGEFPQALIKSRPPAGGGWRETPAGPGFRLTLPPGAKVDATPSGSRLLQAYLNDSPQRPRPSLRVDAFLSQAEEGEAADADFSEEYAEAYGKQSFGGRFNVTDRALVVAIGRERRPPVVVVGGSYLQGAARAYRLHWMLPGKERQLHVTFDCAEGDWPEYQPVLARVLLSFTAPRGGK